MIWQDMVIMAAQAAFGVALFPALLGPQKPPRTTCVVTGVLLLVVAGTLLTLDLWWGAVTTAFCGGCWLVLTLQHRDPEINPWREAVIDALVVNCIYAKKHDDDPFTALHDLVCWEQKIALDPAVSSDAQALIDLGRRQNGEAALALVHAPNAELWVESPSDFLEGWRGKELPATFHAYTERLYRAYKSVATSLSPEFKVTHRHAEGGEYMEVDRCILVHTAKDTWLPGVLYRDKDGRRFVRTAKDFGERFRAL